MNQSRALAPWDVPRGIIAGTQILVYGGVVIAGDGLRSWLQSRPAANLWLARAVGALLIGAGLFTGIEGWRSF